MLSRSERRPRYCRGVDVSERDPRTYLGGVAVAAAVAAAVATLLPGPMWLVRCGGLFGLVGMLVLTELNHDAITNYRALSREYEALAKHFEEMTARAKAAVKPAKNEDGLH